MVEIIAEDSLSLEDGQHKGKILGVEDRESKEGYKYSDIIIEESKTGIKLKCGVPSRITANTSLGLILENFGIEVQPKKAYDPDSLLKNKLVSFLTKKKGNFAEVIPDTLKPVK